MTAPRARGPVRSARALFAAAVLALFGALALPAAAQDQAAVLVSNVEQRSLVTVALRDGRAYAQTFTVGADGGNYTLSSIEILKNNAGISSADMDMLTVAIWSTHASGASAGHPDSPLYTLTKPASIASGESLVRFDAPPNSTLGAGKTYAVVIIYTKSFDNVFNAPAWSWTATTAEDANPASGWSIGDAAHRREPGSTSWRASSTDVSKALAIRVNGTAGGGEPVWSATMTAGETRVGHGYDATDPPAVGALDGDDFFDYGSLSYRVVAIDVASNVVRFNIEPGGQLSNETLTLEFGGHALAFSDLLPVSLGQSLYWSVPDALDDLENEFPVGSTATVCLRTDTQVCPLGRIVTPELRVADDVSAEEGENLTFTVELSPASTATVTVDWTTSEGTATSGTDFSAGSGTLTFAPGVTEQTFTVATTEDMTEEDHETFTVTLSNATNAAISGATATGTIENDDWPPLAWSTTLTVGHDFLAFEHYGYYASVGSLTDEDFEYRSATYVVERVTVTTGREVFFNLDRSGLPTEDVMTLEIDGHEFPFEDRKSESTDKTWVWDAPVDLHDPATNFPVGSTVLVCLRTEGQVCRTPTPMLSVADVSAAEGEDLTFTARLSVPSTDTVTVDWATSGGTAVSGTDFTAGMGTLTFEPGVREQTFTVSTTEDMTVEEDETFTVTLSNATVAISVATATGTIENDDYPPLAWSTTLTVGNFRDILFGYGLGAGSLTETGFEFGSATYEVSIVGVYIEGGLEGEVTYVRLNVNQAGLPVDNTLTLEIDGHEFPFDEAVRTTGTFWLWNAPAALHDPATNFPVGSTATVCLYTEGNACPTNTAPSFSSSAAFDAEENQTGAGTVLATDSDAGDDVTGYAITGGADEALFEIGATDGALTFKTAPNFEDPNDSDSDNDYVVEVQATSGTGEREKTATQTITVTVTDVDTEVPGKPDAPTVSAASVTSLTVNWSAPANAGPAIDDYDVQYREGTSGDWTDGSHTGTATTATLTGLSENTSYQVQVRATNDEGTGDWSDAGSGRTDANAAPTFSSSATFSAAENQTAAGTVAAADSDADDDITGYAITGGADQALFEIGATSGELTFDAAPNFEDAQDSDTDNDYVVEVQATSGTGEREKTATQTITVTVTDLSGEAPGKPAAPTVAAASVTSLTVSWPAPSNAGPAITDYDVQYREGTSGSWSDGGHTGTAVTATLTGLSENTSYQVQVRATNDEGTGAWSDSGSGATDANAAPAFSSDAAFDAAENQTAAGTVAAADSDADDDITGYAITGGADQALFEIGATTGELTFDAAPNFEDAKDTDTDNDYVVEVQATSGAGEREKTATQTITVTVTDLSGEAPGKPAAPTVAAASVTSLTVSWPAPSNAGPAITDYDVQYREGTSGSWSDGGHTGTAVTATLTGLSENTSYQVQVRATNDEGTGAWSDSGSGATDANAAPAFSSDAAFDAAENQTAAGTVAAADSDADDDITGYAITGGADQALFEIGATSGELTFDAAPNFEDAQDSDTDNDYVVEVQATSGTGEREKTATQTITVTVTDLSGEAPGKPAAPTVAAASVTSLTVSWPAPSNAGPAITDYDVQYREGTSGSWSDGGHTGTAVTATLTGLSENTSYQVQVRATNDEGTGAWSDSGSGATDANAAPSFSSDAAFDAAENQTAAGTVAAADSDADDDITGYAITGGADQALFEIGATTGELTFKMAPNFEDPQDAGTDNTYEVTVQATSGTGTRVMTATQTITVTVTNVDEGRSGTVTIDDTTPMVGDELTASTANAADPDGLPDPFAPAWKWYRTPSAGAETEISGETSATYTVVEADLGATLTAKASWTDEGGYANTLASAATSVVAAATALPTLSIDDAEGDEGGDVTFTVRLSAAAAAEVTVAVATSVETGDTATSGTDFTAKTETLTFAAGETSKTVTVATAGDELAEGNETFTLTLSSPTNAEISDATAKGTIVDDDQPTVGFASESVDQFIVEASGEIKFKVVLSATSTVPITVDWATEAGSAEADVDYTEASGTLTFAPGDMEKTITVAIIDDDLLEGQDKFTVRLSGTDDALVTLGTSSVEARIIDRDMATISVAEETTVDEDAGTVTLTLTASAMAVDAMRFDYRTEDGTAEAGADYTAANGRVTIPAGETERTITITVLDDTADEDREDFKVRLVDAAGDDRDRRLILPTAPASVLIEDDDPEPTLSVADAEATEGSPVVFTVALSAASGKTVTVAVATSVETGDTATSGTDFTAKTETLTFAVGENEKTVTVATAGDELAEGNETFTLTLSNPTNATIPDATAKGTIENLPTLSIANASANEGSSISFPLTLSAAAGGLVAVNCVASFGSGNTAVAADLSNTAAAASIRPGEVAGSCSFNSVQDNTDEEDEIFTVTLTSVSTNAQLAADPTAKGTITDDDPTPTVTVAGAEATEGRPVVFTVTLSAVSGRDVEVGYATSVATDDTAVSGTDFTAKTETLTFAAGETSKTVTVATAGDELAEGNETFTLTLSSPTNAEISDATAKGTIVDDDQPTVGFASESVDQFIVEASGEIKFKVVLSATSTVPITVDWATEAGSAEADVDYTEASGTLTFAPGDMEKTITVAIIDDDLLEGQDKFTVRLSGTDDALVTLGTSSVEARIIDRDMATISVAEETTVDEDAGTVTLTLTASAMAVDAMRFDYRTEDGTAEAGADYTAANGRVTIPAGETERTITITVLDDTADEDREDFKVRLVDAAGDDRDRRLILPTAPASVLIEDDDPEPTLSVADAEATEGSPVVFTVALSAASGKTVTVAVATSVETGDTATSGTDFTAKTETLTFDAGQEEKTITVQTTEDTANEENETFTVTLSNPTNATIPDATAKGTIEDDDEPNAAPSFDSSASHHVAENTTAVVTVTARDADTGDDVTGYAITGGADQALFEIGATTGVLTFKTAPNFEDPKDSGTDNDYVVTVQATSGAGERVKTATQTITVTVTDVDPEAPGKPAAPTVAAASVTSLTVNWSAPSNAGPAITDYDVQYRAGTSGSWTDGNHTGTATTATLTGLSENTAYQVQVRATNDEGTGDWSDAGSGTTDANAAPSFDSSASHHVAENTTAVVTVTARDADTGDDVTGYAITGGADQALFEIGATTGVLTFKTAPNFEDPQDSGTDNDYVVTVQATSGTGTREKTATQTITVTVTDVSGEAPGKPAAPTVAAASVTSLSVSWSAPSNAGPAITDYDVRYRAGTSGSWTDGNHTGTATTATLTGLSENTAYQVQVRATNDEGTGDWSDAGSGTTDANAAPSFDSSASHHVAENTTAVVTVTARDADTGDDVTGYAITGGADQALFEIGATTGVLTFKTAPNFEDPQDSGTDNDYVVTVQATSGTGTREKTATQTITVTVTDVDPEAPGKPAAPTVAAASVTSLSVNWSAPSNAGPAITDYDVQYRAGTSGSWTDGNYTGTATTATLTGLSENTAYQVQVRATNDEGTGAWSDAGSGTTDANAAPSFDSSASHHVAENTTAVVTVTARDADTGDDVTGYAITGGADQALFEIGATTGVLTFKTAPNFEDPDDANTDGRYQVTVEATSGTGTREKTATQTITVTVTDVSGEAPGKPAAPDVAAASVTSLTVSWSAPANAGPAITDYDVRYREGTSGSWSDWGHTGTATTATLTGLSENTSYDVQVRATNDEGTGAWSDAGSGTTDANAAPAFTSPATFDAAENQTEVAMVMASDSDSEDKIERYDITGGADQSFFLVIASSGHLEFRDAPNYEDAQDQGTNNTYVVEVRATSGTGEREKTATQTITVTVTDVSGEAPGKPAAPTVAPVSVTSLTVSWSAPSNAGPAIDDYDVRYREGTSGSWTDGTHTGTATTATLTGLSENTSHQVQVRATNDEGTGDWSDAGSGRTDASSNAAPSFSTSAFDAAENQTTAGTVLATDSDAGDDVTGYAITGGADQAFFSIGATSGALTFKTAPNYEDARDQGGNNTYVVEVRATSGTGARVKTATQTITVTVTDVTTEAPGKPAAPTVSAASVTSLSVNWSAPSNAGPAIDDYDVRYRAGTSGGWSDGGHNGAARTATLSSLPENTSYQVQVRATNDEGTGSWSDSGSGATGGGPSNSGICDRTPRVRDRILVLLKNRHSYKGDCSGVTEEHLAMLESLDLGRNPSTESPFTMSLRRDDFEGLVNLERLYMREIGLESLPAGVFDGLAKLEDLELNKNKLTSLPSGVFSDLRSLESLKLQKNPSLESLPYDEFEALPELSYLPVDLAGRRKLQVAGGEGDASLEVAAGGTVTYRVRLMATTNARAANPVTVTVSSDVSAVTASPETVSFTRENWFRRQTVTVRAAASASGTTAKLTHTADGAYYAYDRWPLPGVTVTAVQSGQSGDAAGLTAEFEGLPPEGHGGETAFSFRIAFSEDVATSADDMRDHAFQASGGAVRDARRLRKGSNRMWEMTVKPNSNDPVTITLPARADCGADGAICTGDGRPLSHALSATLRGPAGTMEQDRAARLCSALAGGDDANPAAVAAALWEDGDMSDDRLAALDSLGNGNGSYDLGDLLAWMNRCRRGEGPGSASGTEPPSPPPALPASRTQGGASRRRRGARGPARRRRTAPAPPAAGSRARRSGWLRTALLAALISAWGCGDGIVGPRADAPRHDAVGAAVVDPGPLHVRLTAPAGARDIGAMLVVEGPAIDSVQAPGLEIFETDESSSTRREVVIAGALPPDAPVLRVWVPHRGDQARYRIRLLQVAGEDFTLRDLTAYGTAISR
ncbi:Calx-beta domain-containing protein [Candidatus Palauibacter sp.]|uniref:Calx-beta domain-containing protein n=1 Tax=Candidatus Palauibacter sp. TaxID=3101350 RepID=UPI003B5AC466